MTEEKAHSKFSASGFERIANCSGSVSLSEGLPDKSSEAANEGTLAHTVLETILKRAIKENGKGFSLVFDKRVSDEMVSHAYLAANQILKIHKGLPGSQVMVESKVSLAFIHPEAFGTLDAAVLDYFGTLHILDFKYGFTFVSPKENYQFIFYAMAVAYANHWNFKNVRMWTLQPRVKGFDGFIYWEISIGELKKYIPIFKEAIDRVEKYPDKYTEGSWCWFCKAKKICPLKRSEKLDYLNTVFKPNSIDTDFY